MERGLVCELNSPAAFVRMEDCLQLLTPMVHPLNARKLSPHFLQIEPVQRLIGRDEIYAPAGKWWRQRS
jgi:hypothetical protein